MITVSNEQMTKQIMEMDKTVENIRIHSSEVAASMEQVLLIHGAITGQLNM